MCVFLYVTYARVSHTPSLSSQEDVSLAVGGTEEVPDDIANRMSLFYANPTPMLNVLTAAMSRLVVEVCGGPGSRSSSK